MKRGKRGADSAPRSLDVSFRFFPPITFFTASSIEPVGRTLAVSRFPLLLAGNPVKNRGAGGRKKEKREERRQHRGSSFDVAPFKAGRAPSTSQNICYGHEERKVTGYTQGVLNTSCLLGIVTFLAKRQQRRECWYYIAWPPPFALLAITGPTMVVGHNSRWSWRW